METNLHEKSPQKAKKKKLTFQDLNLGASELSGSVYLQHFNVSLSPALLVHYQCSTKSKVVGSNPA